MMYQPKAFQTKEIQMQIAELAPKPPKIIAWQHWRFAVGTSEETLRVSLSDKPIMSNIVNLPHRVNLPNTPLWYARKVKLDTAKLLLIQADDGAQVFYNGEQVMQRLANKFVLLPTLDSTDLIIRVLNNALQGGLKKVEWMDMEQGIAYFEQMEALHLLNPIYKQVQHLMFAPPFVQRIAAGEYLVKVVARNHLFLQLQFGQDSTQLNQIVSPLDTMNGIYTFGLKHLSTTNPCYYKIKVGNTYSSIYTLQPEKDDVPFSFATWGDSQGGWSIFQQLTRQMHRQSPAFTVGLGDLVADGSSRTQWLAFLYALQPLSTSIPTFTLLGNHDYDGYYDDLVPKYYQQYIKRERYFSWTYNNCAFIALDPNERFPIGIEDNQKTWLLNELKSEAWQNADWRFLLVHQPPYSQGWEAYHGDAFMEELITQYAESAKIDVVLSGHSHCYERLSKEFGLQKTHFFVMGGAGGGLEAPANSDFPNMDVVIKKHHYGFFTINKTHIDLKVMGLNNIVLDALRIEK